jgi:hypothetical protein
MIHELSYEFDATLYTEHSDAHTYGHRAGWRGFFLTGPRSDLVTAANFSMGRVVGISSNQPASMPTVTLAPDGENYFKSYELQENANYQLSHAWRTSQSAVARRSETSADIENPDTMETERFTVSVGNDVGGGLSGDRSWQYDSLTLAGTLNYVVLDTLSPGNATATNTELLSTSSVTWRRDLGLHWSASADVGMSALIPLSTSTADGTPSTDSSPSFRPTLGASLNYSPEWGSASAQIRRAIAPNLLIAQNTVSDSAILSAWLPLPWLAQARHEPRLTVQASGGINRTQIIDIDNGDSLQSFTVYSGDVGLNYAARSALNFTLRGSYVQQVAGDDVATNPGMDALTVNDYHRLTISLMIAGRFPERRAAEIPERASTRVDRSDVTPVGEEAGAEGAPSTERR